MPWKALGEVFEFDVGPFRWPALGELAAAVESRRRETAAAAGQVVRVARKHGRLRSQAREMDRLLVRSRRRRECLKKARLVFLDRLERLDRRRAADRIRLAKETARLALALNDTRPPRRGQPVPAELAPYVESVLELRRPRTSAPADDDSTGRLRRALGRIGPKLDREERLQARLTTRRDARQRAAEHGAEIVARRRRLL
ncbi:MAG: hypothetical protein KKC37_02645, partial [Proteobacteria bacterium]|nr:hypothetical protein [Pseudomonadota bacterium]